MKEYRRECETWAEENQGAIGIVQNKLRSYGGTKVSPQPQPNISILAKCGMLVKPLRVTLRKGRPNACYENVIEMWNARGPRSTLVCRGLGYALSEDGMWRPHHWGFSFTKGEYKIIETTVPWLMYWGLPDGLGACDTHHLALLMDQLFDLTSLDPTPILPAGTTQEKTPLQLCRT